MKNHSLNALLIILVSTSLIGASPYALAAVTDISSAPLASSPSTVVKPNVMFILDDSLSMQEEYMPDAVATNKAKNCYKNSKYNGIYYDPNTTYLPPVDAAGVSFSNANYSSALIDGFGSSSGGKTNLGNQFKAGADTVGQQAYYYKYTTGTPLGTCEADSKYTKVSVASGDAEAQNFANWYTYYRTRQLTMKTVIGRAFKNITSDYRVGYSTINYTGTDSTNTNFQKISDFDLTQKTAWYSKLYSAGLIPDTPLHAALSKAGRIYAGKGLDDPVQYSCQQNFAILSTDGYWRNANSVQVDGTTSVGNQDNDITTSPRPKFDGSTTAAPNKSTNTLADVARYYYVTDLRNKLAFNNCTGALGSGTDVCEDNVPGAGDDINTQQHMTTFTLGLGVNGTLAYTEDYTSGGSADFEAIKQGTKNWPTPISNDITGVDDLWHAAVNGNGTYFSAKNPDSLISGIGKALAGISARKGSASAAATSNLEPVAGDNFVYIALYTTVSWFGDLQALTIDPNTGVISSTPVWTAQPLLDTKVSGASDTRTIYTFDNSAASKLKPFTWTSLNATEQGYFNNICPSAKLSQCSSLTAAQQTAVSGANLVNFIRGQDGFENQSTNTDKLYRDRIHVMGDMVSSQPVYVKAPAFDYTDTNYDIFKNTTQKNRAAIVYVAANDGMLHAFDGATGQEQWAYIPPIIMSNLYLLADFNYSANHHYYVDGSPTAGDICANAPATTCTGTQWKTILVGGLNAGGRGYYALDITNPATPKALWNFTVNDDSDLGYTFGNPIITKRQDGTWVVVFTSGYNNVLPGSGQGFLYVLRASDGTLLEKIPTNSGTVASPSGLAKINSWVSATSGNTAMRFYGGDMNGDVWRFDIDDVVAPAGKEALLLATLGQVDIGTQPITTKPELSELVYGGNTYAVVHVGTGRYLGVSDKSDVSQQSVYSFKDELTATGLGKLRTSGVMVQQTLIPYKGPNGEQFRKTTTNLVDWSTKGGWYVDLNPNNDSPGERVNVDMQMQLGVLTVAGNVPSPNACTLGGYAWLYFFDFKTGQYLSTSAGNIVGKRLSGNALIAGMKSVKLTTGKVTTIITDTGGSDSSEATPSSSGAGGSTGKRTSWRELTN